MYQIVLLDFDCDGNGNGSMTLV